ncbi:MAG: SIS domain-containing protein [Kosmotogaceae bacterium]
MKPYEITRKAFEESIRVKKEFIDRYEDDLLLVAKKITTKIRNGGTIYLIGNGGSAADAAHLSAELMGKFYLNRKPIRAISLASNDSILTEIPNDFGFEQLFSRQLEAFLKTIDTVIAISTSGNSENVIRALYKAKEKQSLTVCFSGRTGGKMNNFCDFIFKVDSDDIPRIQETHITLGHVLCQLIEELFVQAE